MMRFVKLLTIIVFTLWGFGMCAQVISNPEKPASGNAGRIAKITQALRINDDGKRYFFKFPSNIKVAPDGSIFVVDKAQLLRFDKNGTFLGNLQKKGEGPGEYLFILDFKVIDDHIFTIALLPPKNLELDLSGKVIKETRRPVMNGIPKVLDLNKSMYYYIFGAFDREKQKTGLMEFKQNLFVSTYDGKQTDLNLSFPIRRSLVVSKTPDNQVMAMARDLDFFCYAVENENSLYVSHTQKYLVKHVDMAKGKLLREFTRTYNSVPYIQKESDKGNAEFIPREFFPDIEQIALHKGKVWVLTSTIDKNKGILVDVFSKEGKYLDNFYLPLPKVTRPDVFENSPFVIWDDFIFLVERDADDNLSIVKYKIEI